ncbi:MAG: serine/threonine protein kinase, partial [Planctomycetia bacterium]
MAKVYLSEHVAMKRQVAVKVLPKSIGAGSLGDRFHREARAIATLNHPNIIQAFDFDSNDDALFIVMELVRGMSVQELIGQFGPVAAAYAADFVCQACAGLQHAHAAGLIHRDIKPGNLLVDGTGQVKIVDLGLAFFFEERDGSLTMADPQQLLGTVDYVSPEQSMHAREVDGRTDIYSLGATLYFLLSGQPPFVNATLPQKLVMHQMQHPRPIHELAPNVPDGVAEILEIMMAKRPDDRFASPAHVIDALLPFAQRMTQPFNAAARSMLKARYSFGGEPSTAPADAPTSLSAGASASTPSMNTPLSYVESQSAVSTSRRPGVAGAPTWVPPSGPRTGAGRAGMTSVGANLPPDTRSTVVQPADSKSMVDRIEANVRRRPLPWVILAGSFFGVALFAVGWAMYAPGRPVAEPAQRFATKATAKDDASAAPGDAVVASASKPDAVARTVKAPATPIAASSDEIEILFTYGSEKEAWLNDVTATFNALGRVTKTGKRIRVVAVATGSGECINDVISGSRKAHLTSPASGVFIRLGNSMSDDDRGIVGKPRLLVNSPVVVAMWKPMAQALGWGVRPIGWQEILELARNPQGWGAYDF